MEYDLILGGTVESVIDLFDLIISTITFIGCLYLIPTMIYWWWNIRNTPTNLRPLIEGIAEAKLGILIWTGSQIYMTTRHNADLPNWSLPARILIMIAVARQVWVTSRIKPPPEIENIPVSLNKDGE